MGPSTCCAHVPGAQPPASLEGRRSYWAAMILPLGPDILVCLRNGRLDLSVGVSNGCQRPQQRTVVRA
jgi:hypothetical protein